MLEWAATEYRAPLAGPDGFRKVVHAMAGPPPTAAALPPGQGNFYRLLPVVDAGVIELARRIPEGARSDRELARLIKACLLGGFQCSLRALEQAVDDPPARWLFENRKGHGECFGSAMAVLLRTVSAPARAAVDYREGNENSLTGWHVVRASDARGRGLERRPRVGGIQRDASRS